MTKKKPLIPFELVPGYWGTTGKFRERAKAEYELEGEELDKALARIDLSGDELSLKLLDIDLQYGNIDDCHYAKDRASMTIKDETELQKTLNEIEYEYGEIGKKQYLETVAKLTLKGVDFDLRMNDIRLELGEISDKIHERNKADILGEPWVDVIKLGVNGKEITQGEIELDWNSHFVEKLKKSGYKGDTDEDLVNQWLIELCRNMVMEEMKDYITEDEADELNKDI